MNKIIKLKIYVTVNNRRIELTENLERKGMSLETITDLVKKCLTEEDILKDDFYLVDDEDMKITSNYIKYFLKESKYSLTLNVNDKIKQQTEGTNSQKIKNEEQK